MCFQHKMKNLVWTKGTSGLEGEFQSASEVDFYIDTVCNTKHDEERGQGRNSSALTKGMNPF